MTYYKFVLVGKKDWPNINYFPYLNHTKNGYTKDITNLLNIPMPTMCLKILKNNALGSKLMMMVVLVIVIIQHVTELVEETSNLD